MMVAVYFRAEFKLARQKRFDRFIGIAAHSGVNPYTRLSKRRHSACAYTAADKRVRAVAL